MPLCLLQELPKDNDAIWARQLLVMWDRDVLALQGAPSGWQISESAVSRKNAMAMRALQSFLVGESAESFVGL
jgi:hypothetical protein